MSKESASDMLERIEAMAEDDGDTWDLSDNDRAALAWAARELRNRRDACICEIDRHDFSCPVHNDAGPSRRGPNGDE